MPKITKLLVANRGEIALRIMRTAREEGIPTVAIFSEADRQSPHVRYADEAICIGPPPSSQSYLNIAHIIDACHQTGANAVHPGYGFLSENAAFAQRVADEGLIFVGPSPKAIETMGSKLAAKAAAKSFGVPLVPGTEQAVTDIKTAKAAAAEIGYPILIKASAGGGGKGMRMVEEEKDFEPQMERAVSEATSAFGDGSVFIEKFIVAPKHIEIQILGDQHGNLVYLFERECSIQRRYQKVIEEAPSAVVTKSIREAMGKAAIGVAKACNYVGAGTIEFVMGQDLQFYFLEMNTRLQVEHPVTEMITGIDLVKQQLKIAEGEKLSFRQEDLHIHGHAIEVRVYAEDPANNFLPDTGKLQTYRRPQGPGIRVDDGFEEGMQIPVYYDPMIAKLIVHAEDREAAIRRMLRAIHEYEISGVETTLDFCRFVMQHEAFTSGHFDTKFVEQFFTPKSLSDNNKNEHPQKVAAFIAAHLYQQQQQKPSQHTAVSDSSQQRMWKQRKFL
ncbi:acetyl-CoA carboxylase biotin carboxylase subunit [Catalinimonas niigatensis]|uniref:acetyl-CoA carboxylase biotin carboxylase subunit n=1 Tax=Catalinimonas niigatensis TaxID=1397264 RepID=UPI0026657254|nr:acetyl-CoA carboxylase biotin carboxylase subunit [Catalinimonas niigatensis]WPP52979.1 acetyl-CoA carboxylase biotin carboxylase subunit [Catalinimonas niigatensis]